MLVHGGKREIQPDRCNWEHLNAYRVINAKYMQKTKQKSPVQVQCVAVEALQVTGKTMG